MQVWNVLHAARWKYRMQKITKNLPSGHHHTTLSGCIFANKACIDNCEKNLLNSNISSRCPHNMANFGPLTAEIVSLVWGTPANFSGFHILSSLLQRCRSTEENQTLHAVWPSPGLVHYTFSGALAPGRNFARCKIHFTSKFCVLLYWQHCSTALQQRASAKLCGMVQGMELRNFCRGRYLYLPGQPSRWALSHILVKYWCVSQWLVRGTIFMLQLDYDIFCSNLSTFILV